MPYIVQAGRKALEERRPQSPGELNYMVTMLVNDYLAHYGKSYETINAIVGVLECAKLEMYRRIAAPYEDLKLLENGDVYTV